MRASRAAAQWARIATGLLAAARLGLGGGSLRSRDGMRTDPSVPLCQGGPTFLGCVLGGHSRPVEFDDGGVSLCHGRARLGGCVLCDHSPPVIY